MISFIKTSLVIAGAAFKELLNERILYNIFFISLFLLCFGYLAALLVYGHQDKVMLHFGTMVNALSIYVVASGAGARILRGEFDKRTCYIPLSRPISRVGYYYGKWLGIVSFSFLNLVLLTFLLLIGLRITGGHENLAYFQSFWLIWIETFIVAAFSLLLSLFLRPGLSAMVTMAYLFLSHNHDQIEFLKHQGSDASGIFSVIQMLTPNGQVLLMDTRVYYDFPLSFFEFWQRTGYGCLWTLFFLLIGNAIFYRKNL